MVSCFYFIQLQKDVRAVNAFTQGVSNIIQVTLSPRIDKLVQGLNSCLATVTKEVAGENGISKLKLEMIQKEIREVGLMVKNVHECSKTFVAHCSI